MVNRVQTLRSTVPGARPAGRLPGELYVNWPDLQFGVIDPTNAAVDLIPIRYFSTLTSYAIGDHVVQGDNIYRAIAAVAPGPFNPAQWVGNSIGDYLPLTGGTLTGQLFAPGYVMDGPAATVRGMVASTAGSSRWIMELADATAEGAGAAGSNFALQSFDNLGVAIGTPLTINRASGVTTLVNLSAPQAIGDNRIINGNFAVNQRGHVSGAALPANPTVANGYGHDRWKAGVAGCSYTFTAALPDTTITITAGTLTQIIEAGMIEGGVYTLSWTGTAQARVYQGAPAGANATSPIVTAALPAGVNTVVEFNAGTVTRVKLEIGSVATPFNRQSLAKSRADCQRYYSDTLPLWCTCYVAGPMNFGQTITFPTAVRASPTISFVGVNYVNAAAIGIAIGPTATGVALDAAAQAAGPATFAAAQIVVSAEL